MIAIDSGIGRGLKLGLQLNICGDKGRMGLQAVACGSIFEGGGCGLAAVAEGI